MLLKNNSIIRPKSLMVAVLAGVVTTYVVSWILIYHSYRTASLLFGSQRHSLSAMTDHGSDVGWYVDSWRTETGSVVALSWYSIGYDIDSVGGFGRLHSNWGLLPEFISKDIANEIANSKQNRVYFKLMAGWPYRSLMGSYSSVNFSYESEIFSYSVPTSDTSSKFRLILPFKPIMPGFLQNTLAYTSIYYLVMALGGKLCVGVIRRARKRKSSCEICGYSVENLFICPECGEEVTKPATVQQ